MRMKLKTIITIGVCFLFLKQGVGATDLSSGELFYVAPIGEGSSKTFTQRFNLVSEQYELREMGSLGVASSNSDPSWASFSPLTVKDVICVLNQEVEPFVVGYPSVVFALSFREEFLLGDEEIIVGGTYRAVNEAEWLCDRIGKMEGDLSYLKNRLVELARASGR